MNKYLADNGSNADGLEQNEKNSKLKKFGQDSNGQSLSFLDLTKPSLEVFI
jgi:hypothetical protein